MGEDHRCLRATCATQSQRTIQLEQKIKQRHPVCFQLFCFALTDSLNEFKLVFQASVLSKNLKTSSVIVELHKKAWRAVINWFDFAALNRLFLSSWKHGRCHWDPQGEETCAIFLLGDHLEESNLRCFEGKVVWRGGYNRHAEILYYLLGRFSSPLSGYLH